MSTQKKDDSSESWEKLEEREADHDGEEEMPISPKVADVPKLVSI